MSDRAQIQCGAAERDGVRGVVATLGSRQHVDKFDVRDNFRRSKFIDKAIAKLRLDPDAHEWMDDAIVAAAAAEDESPQTAQLATANVINFSAVSPKPIHWFWDGYMPLGAISLLMGDPNEGKSQLAINIVARRTRGLSMPPHELPTGGKPGAALLLSAEDDLERTTLPRLIAAGGDPRRVHHLREVTPWNSAQPRLLQLPTDIPAIEAVIERHGIDTVVIDVFSAFIAEGLNQNSDSDMRACLSVLSAMAERTQACIILLAHMNKKEGTRSMYRSGGSVAIIGAARAAFAVGPHPDDPTEKVFCAVKHNLGPKPPSLTYRIEAAETVSRVVWGGQTELSAADVLGSQGSSKGGSGGNKLEQAKEIMAELLADGPRGSNEVLGAIEAAGIGERTYHSARKALGVMSERTGFGRDGQWLLTMPANGACHDDF